MIVRRYMPDDCEQMSVLFYDTVHSVNAKDYTRPQLDVWATGSVDLDVWNRTFLEHFTVVAVEGDIVVGFGDIDGTGYLDRLYVHKDYQGRGIAKAICDELEKQFPATRVLTHASVTARPFFEKRGYVVMKNQEVELDGIKLKNHIMTKG